MLLRLLIIMIAFTLALPSGAAPEGKCATAVKRTLQYFRDHRYVFKPIKPGELNVEYYGFLTKSEDYFSKSPLKKSFQIAYQVIPASVIALVRKDPKFTYTFTPGKGIGHLLDVPFNKLAAKIPYFKDERKAGTPIKIALLIGAFFAYEGFVGHLEESAVLSNIKRNEVFYSQQILYDARYSDIKIRLEEHLENMTEALKDAYWRTKSLEAFLQNYVPTEITAFAQVAELVQFPPFEHLKRVFRERNLHIETWDNIFQVNNVYISQLVSVEKFISRGSAALKEKATPADELFKDDPFFLYILEKRDQGLSEQKTRYILHQWLYWKKTIAEAEQLKVDEQLPNMKQVEEYLEQVAEKKYNLIDRLEDLGK